MPLTSGAKRSFARYVRALTRQASAIYRAAGIPLARRTVVLSLDIAVDENPRDATAEMMRGVPVLGVCVALTMVIRQDDRERIAGAAAGKQQVQVQDELFPRATDLVLGDVTELLNSLPPLRGVALQAVRVGLVYPDDERPNPEPDAVPALMDFARRGDKAGFTDLARAVGVAVDELEAMWAGTLARLAREPKGGA